MDLEEEKVEATPTFHDHAEEHVPVHNNEVSYSGIQLPNSEVEVVLVHDAQPNKHSEEESEALVGRPLGNAEYQGTVVQETQLEDQEDSEDRLLIPLARTNTLLDSGDETDDGFQQS